MQTDTPENLFEGGSVTYFKWADDLVIDNGPIDADHHRLVDLVNALHTATSQGEGKQVVGEILDQLIAYSQQHFRREEQIMEIAKFPKLEEHKAEHQELTDKVIALQQKYNDGSITVATQLSSLLRDWLSLHMRRSDRELHAFEESKRRSNQG